MVPIGILAAAGAAAALDPNWRALFALGLLPLLSVVLHLLRARVAALAARAGRSEEARQRDRLADRATRGGARARGAASRRDVRNRAPRTCCATASSVIVTVLAWIGASAAVSGLVLWGPTFLEQILDVDSDKAAGCS